MRDKLYAASLWAGLLISMIALLSNGFIFSEAENALPLRYRISIVAVALATIGGAYLWVRWFPPSRKRRPQ